jgi:hypothetical protein
MNVKIINLNIPYLIMDLTFKLLQAGAVDFIEKPLIDITAAENKGPLERSSIWFHIP